LYAVADSFMHVLPAEATLAVSLSFISGTDSALLYETLRAKGKEASYPQVSGFHSSVRGPSWEELPTP
jgi:hypothetical protein